MPLIHINRMTPVFRTNAIASPSPLAPIDAETLTTTAPSFNQFSAPSGIAAEIPRNPLPRQSCLVSRIYSPLRKEIDRHGLVP
jgi:hypothetical protein